MIWIGLGLGLWLGLRKGLGSFYDFYHHLFYIAFAAVTEFVPLNHSRANFYSTDGDFSVYQQTARFHRQWQQCPTAELVNTTTRYQWSKQTVKKKQDSTNLSSFNQIQTEIDEFYFDANISWQKLFLPVRLLPRNKNGFSTVWPNLLTLTHTHAHSVMPSITLNLLTKWRWRY